MERFRHGLVAGRFAPFHLGHSRLVRQASERCDRVTVQIVSRRGEEIPSAVRAGWVRELHPDVHVVVNRSPVSDDISDRAWRAGYAPVFTDLLDQPVDALFTLEEYGADFARLLGARWIRPDHGHRRIRVSGTAVRAAPERHWSLLPAPVRAWYVRRIVVLGADDGRSTRLSRALADALGCGLVGCATREWVRSRPTGAEGSVPGVAEIARIRARQSDLSRLGSGATPDRWLVCQADDVWLDAWLRHRSGVPADVADPMTSTGDPVHLYVLEQEPTGVHGTSGGVLCGVNDLLRADLVRRGLPWIEVGGDLDARVSAVLARLPDTGVRPLLDPASGY